MSALVIAEHDNASIKGATLNTVTAALACGGEVHVLVAGHNAAAAAAAAAQIVGVSKVIHADIHIACCHERRHGSRQHGHLGAAAGKLDGVDAALGLEALRQMGVGVQGNAFGSELIDQHQRAVK